jgi:hypothetical protein
VSGEEGGTRGRTASLFLNDCFVTYWVAILLALLDKDMNDEL